MRILIPISFVLLAISSHAQSPAFFKLFSNQGDDAGEGVIQLPDSTYMITGASSSFLSGGGQAFLLHIDTVGNYIWSGHYGGEESEGGRRVLHKPGNGYYIAGYTNSIGNGGFDMYLVKTDEFGVQEWEKAYGDYGWERVHDAALTSDTGLIMVGETSSNPNEDVDAYIVRTDRNGDILWTKKFGNVGGEDKIEAIAPLNDSVFYCVGRLYNPDSLMYKAYIMRLHENGTIEWSDTLGDNGNYTYHELDIEQVHLNQIAVMGHHEGGNSVGRDEYIARFFLDGTLDFQYTIPSAGFRESRAIAHYGDTNKYYGCFEHQDQWSHQDGVDVNISRYNDAVFWDVPGFSVGFPLPDHMGEMIPTNDGGVICVGKTNSEGAGVGVNHVFVAKIGKSAYPNTLTPHDMEGIATLNEAPEIEGLQLYPNPVRSTLNVRLAKNEGVKVVILNAMGQVIDELEGLGTLELSVDGYQTGMYLVNVETEKARSVRRVTILH